MRSNETIIVQIHHSLSNFFESIDFDDLEYTIKDLGHDCKEAINTFFIELANFEFVEYVHRTNAENACHMLSEVLDAMVEEGDIYINDDALLKVWGSSHRVKNTLDNVLEQMTGKSMFNLYKTVEHKAFKEPSDQSIGRVKNNRESEWCQELA